MIHTGMTPLALSRVHKHTHLDAEMPTHPLGLQRLNVAMLSCWYGFLKKDVINFY
jgi:hypothetical protein